MANLYDILGNAEGGEAMAMLSREFGLTPGETEAAVAALLPAISTGLKRSTATPEGLGNLLGVMGQQQNLCAMYDDPGVAFAQEGRAAGNDVLSVIFGSPDVSRAVAAQAQRFSGIDAGTLKKLLPALAGILISGLMGSKSAGAGVPQSPAAPTGGGGGLGDILGQIFGRATSAPSPQQIPTPGGQPIPAPTGSDLFGYILRELEQGLRDGRIKPVIIGGGFPLPGGQGGPGQQAPTQAPGGEIFGQILRDLLGGAVGGGARAPQQPGQSPQMKDLSDMSKQVGLMGGAGAAMFGDRFEAGRDVEQDHLDSIQSVFDRFAGAQRR
jgi:hypothetical protein